MLEDDRSYFYDGYSAHKKWVQGQKAEDVDRFSRTFRRILLPPACKILEVGFGEGRFLDWAKREGHEVEGIEILPEMVELSRVRGHRVYLGEMNQLRESGRRFDLLVAIDVIEHLTIGEILDLLQDADSLLHINGRILLQFPNSSSPFSALYQNGDVTHRSALSSDSLEQISQTKGWTVSEAFNARASWNHPLKQVKWWIAYRIRDLIEMVVSFAYYGTRCPLDPNIIVVLKRSQVNTVSALSSDASA